MGKTYLTKAQWLALKWLDAHGGDAVFDRHGIALAQGETAPVMRSTWNTLSDLGFVDFYGGIRDGGSGYGRLKLTPEPVTDCERIAAAERPASGIAARSVETGNTDSTEGKSPVGDSRDAQALSAAGYAYQDAGPFTGDTTILHVETNDMLALKKVIEACEAECRKMKKGAK